MCFSATANFVGSGVLGTVGVVTLTKVVELGGSRDSVLTARPMSKDGSKLSSLESPQRFGMVHQIPPKSWGINWGIHRDVAFK